MKKFTLNNHDYECEEKYKYAAIDETGDCWVYTDNPFLTESGWDGSKEMEMIAPVIETSRIKSWHNLKIRL